MFLDKYVDPKLKEVFDKYYLKYCKFEVTISRTRDIISDIKYFSEHIKRTQKSKFISYVPLPSNDASIHNRFVKKIGENILYNLYDENRCMIYISLYEIMESIFKNYYEEDSNAVVEYNEFRPVLMYYLGEDNDFLDCFIGCSSGYRDFVEKLNQLNSGVVDGSILF